MPKSIKKSSKQSSREQVAVKAKVAPAKVKPVVAKPPVKVASKVQKMPPAKTVAAAEKPQLSVQELQDRVAELERTNSTLQMKSQADRKSLTDVLAQIKTLQAELEKSIAASPLLEAAPVPDASPSPSSISAPESKTAPTATPKPTKKSIVKRGKIKT